MYQDANGLISVQASLRLLPSCVIWPSFQVPAIYKFALSIYDENFSRQKAKIWSICECCLNVAVNPRVKRPPLKVRWVFVVLFIGINFKLLYLLRRSVSDCHHL